MFQNNIQRMYITRTTACNLPDYMNVIISKCTDHVSVNSVQQ